MQIKLLLSAVVLATCTKGEAAQPFRPSTFTSRPHGASVDASAPRARACGVARSSPEGETHRIGDRTFHVWGPREYDAARSWPVVVAFHGQGSNGRDFAAWFKMEKYVEGRAFVVYPDARGNWDSRGASDLDFFDAIMTELLASFCVDPSRVLALGFSMGGKIAQHVGCDRTSSVKAIAVGGTWPNDPRDCGRLPVLVVHRTRDSSIGFASGKGVAEQWRRTNGCLSESDIVDEAHACRSSRGCSAPGSLTFCEDEWFSSDWKPAYNHTIREEYRALVWAWFESLP